MRGFLVAIALMASGSAGAASKPASAVSMCRVEGAKLLPRASGGEAALCAAIRDAASKARLTPGYRVEVQVAKRRSLDGVLVLADGRRLPTLSFDVTDAPLSRDSFRVFAADLIGQARRQR